MTLEAYVIARGAATFDRGGGWLSKIQHMFRQTLYWPVAQKCPQNWLPHIGHSPLFPLMPTILMIERTTNCVLLAQSQLNAGRCTLLNEQVIGKLGAYPGLSTWNGLLRVVDGIFSFESAVVQDKTVNCRDEAEANKAEVDRSCRPKIPFTDCGFAHQRYGDCGTLLGFKASELPKR